MRQSGYRVRAPENLDAGQAVCDGAARRARHNIELIVERLTAQGYRFHDNDDAETPTTPFTPATTGVADRLTWLEATMGPVPLIVSSWCGWSEMSRWSAPTRHGGHRLRATLSSSRSRARDLRTPTSPTTSSRTSSPDRATTSRGRFRLPLAPDHLHKAIMPSGRSRAACQGPCWPCEAVVCQGSGVRWAGRARPDADHGLGRIAEWRQRYRSRLR